MKSKRLSKSKRLAKAKHSSLDIISTLPENIIETILCRLPTQEAGRTSVLSRDWRYKWTKIPKLEFSRYTFKVSTDDNQQSVLEQTSDKVTANERKMMHKRCKIFNAINQVLSLHQGPITDFALDLETDNTCFEIDDIISSLARNNAVKKLKLELSQQDCLYYRIPLSIFSLQHLTDLHLYGCVLNLKQTFIGFRSLTSLYLNNVYILTKTLLRLVSNCPLLKTFHLLLQGETIISDEPDDKNTVIELVESFPKIENLTTWSWITECFVQDAVPRELPVLLLNHLKHISFTSMSEDGLYFLAFLMRCSPNVEKIMIEQDFGEHFSDEMISIILKAYSDIWLEHLNELDIVSFSNLKPELEFVKFILAKSPNLKKVYLLLYDVLDENEESEMLRILMPSPPASQEVEVTLAYVARTYISVYSYTTHFSED